jgi:hypothetical protein
MKFSVKFIQTLNEPITNIARAKKLSLQMESILPHSITSVSLRIYDFDRCTGILSNYKYKYITQNIGGAIIIFT